MLNGHTVSAAWRLESGCPTDEAVAHCYSRLPVHPGAMPDCTIAEPRSGRSQAMVPARAKSICTERDIAHGASTSCARTRPGRPRVGLFVTCLVDLMRPSVGFAAVKLLEDAGCIVEVPSADLLRPAGLQFRRPATPASAIAEQTIAAFAPLRLRRGAVRLLRRHDQGALSRAVRRRSEPRAQGRCARGQDLRARQLPGRCHGCDAASTPRSTARSPITTVARACASSASSASRASCWPASKGLKLVEMNENEVCCGFGGTFASSTPRSPTPSSRRRPSNIAAAGAARCWPAISAA